MRFDQDNTIGDRPMVDVITSLEHMLATASARAGSTAGGATLHQLVLIIADGRWVEGWVWVQRLADRSGRVVHASMCMTSDGCSPAFPCCHALHKTEAERDRASHLSFFFFVLTACVSHWLPPHRRFHEKESLRRMVRAAADKPGVLYAFIVLDNPAAASASASAGASAGGGGASSSILDMQVGLSGCMCARKRLHAGVMDSRAGSSHIGVGHALMFWCLCCQHMLLQTVSFVGGKPVFARYMDSFPFPFYIVLRDTGGQIKGSWAELTVVVQVEVLLAKLVRAFRLLNHASAFASPVQLRCLALWRISCASGLNSAATASADAALLEIVSYSLAISALLSALTPHIIHFDRFSKAGNTTALTSVVNQQCCIRQEECGCSVEAPCSAYTSNKLVNGVRWRRNTSQRCVAAPL
jgi:hypothetical protein